MRILQYLYVTHDKNKVSEATKPNEQFDQMAGEMFSRMCNICVCLCGP